MPGSDMRKLEAQTGLKVSRGDGKYWIFVTGSMAGSEPFTGFFSEKKDEKDACAELRQKNWKKVCSEVSSSQGHMCFSCGQVRPLQGHHVRFRSRWSRSDGPLDVPSNVRMLCSLCHEGEHGR